MSGWDILGAWVAVGLTLFMYSFLYKDNPYFKFGEHLFVGVSMGYSLVRLWYDVMDKQFLFLLREQHQWTLLIPALLGLLILARFVPKLSWLSRLSFAFIVGFGSGVAIPRTISSFVLKQIEGTLKPFADLGESASFWSLLNPSSLPNLLLILVGVTSVLCYFFFSLEHRGFLLISARVGIYFLMVSFGGAFGYTVMARMSLLIGRIDELLLFSGRDYGYATPLLLVALAAALALWEKKQKRISQPREQGERRDPTG
jgi:hypothetical protein